MTAAYKAKAAIMIPRTPAAEAPIWTFDAAPVEEELAAEPDAVPVADEPDPELPVEEEPEEPEPVSEAPEDEPVPDAEAPVPVATALLDAKAPEEPVAAAPEVPVPVKKRELMQPCWHLA